MQNGIQAILPELIYICLALGIGLVLVFCKSGKKAWQALVCSVVVSALVTSVSYFGANSGGVADKASVMPVTLQSENVMEGARSLMKALKTAKRLMQKIFWQIMISAGRHSVRTECLLRDFPMQTTAMLKLSFQKVSEINTAIIEEVGNQAQYFRLQALLMMNGLHAIKVKKIQSMRICSFDTVVSDRIRLSIDKFRDEDTPVKIKLIKLYNEPARNADDFEVTAYQRLDGDVPTEILAKGRCLC